MIIYESPNGMDYLRLKQIVLLWTVSNWHSLDRLIVWRVLRTIIHLNQLLQNNLNSYMNVFESWKNKQDPNRQA